MIARSPVRLLLSSFVAALAWLVAVAPPSGVAAQATRTAPTGEVSGLDMQLEGALTATRGGELSWHVTMFEVRGLSDLRPAHRGDIELTTSIDPAAAPVVVPVDRDGHALVRFPVPADAPDRFGVIVRLVAAGAQRRFEFEVTVRSAATLEVALAPTDVAVGGLVEVIGRIAHVETGRGLPHETVRLDLVDLSGRSIVPRVSAEADAHGLFRRQFRLPRTARGLFRVDVTHGDERHRVATSSAPGTIHEAFPGGISVVAAPSQWITESGRGVVVRAIVRNGRGRPIPNAVVMIPGVTDPRDPPFVTDARGSVELPYYVYDTGAAVEDRAISVSANHPSHGSAGTVVMLRVARVSRAASFSVEGGALVPSIGGRVFVRVVGADGTAAGSGIPVSVRGPRIGAVRALTDDAGAATHEVSLQPLPRDVADRCGGEAATAIDIEVDGGDTVEGCIPLDADGSVRVRAARSMIAPDAPLELDLARAAQVARLPILVRVFSAERAGAVVATAMVAPGTNHVSVPLPAGLEGLLTVRARPTALDSAREARGGSALVFRSPAIEGHELSIDGSDIIVRGAAGRSATVVAVPIERSDTLDSLSSFHAIEDLTRLPIHRATDGLLAAALAAMTDGDAAAAFVVRGTSWIVQPAPEDPASLHLLRDPHRAESRFVTGRLALVFRAIEDYVAEKVPGHIDDVAVLENGRWRFNAQIFNAVADAGGLGGEGATGLGGEPLTTEALSALDPQFDYDAVARRITRQRLFRLLVALRRFVIANDYDVPWVRAGDPSTWLAHTTELYDPALGQLSTHELVDAWGRPFVMARVTGRPRLASWAILPGWEVFSTGPDGRANTADDLFDPARRVLPSTSAYARAVGEDALVARLAGAELGRAALLAFTGGMQVAVPADPESAAVALARQNFDRVPTRFEPPLAPLALRRAEVPSHPIHVVVTETAEGARIAPALGDEPRTYRVTALIAGPDGVHVERSTMVGGVPLFADGDAPERLVVGQRVQLLSYVVNAGEQPLDLLLTSRTPEGLGGEIVPVRNGSVEGTGLRLRVAAGESEPVHWELEPTAPGSGEASIVTDVGGRTVAIDPIELRFDAALHTVRTRSAALVDGSWSTTLDLPDHVESSAARLVLMSPRGLPLDPDLQPLRERDPSLLAFGHALLGQPLDEALRAQLFAAEREGVSYAGDRVLSLAAAAAAWSSFAAEDEAARELAATLRRRLTESGLAESSSGVAGTAALVAILGNGGVPELADLEEGEFDPITRRLSTLRAELRGVLRTSPSEPELLARAAGALALVDARDVHARAMFDRAVRALRDVNRGEGRGQRLVPSEGRRVVIEALTATLALAVAAEQLGDHALAVRLVRGVAIDDHLVMAAGGEALVWWFVAASVGAFGAPSDASIDVGEGRRDVDLSSGLAIVELPAARSDFGLRVSATGAVMARAEAVTDAPHRPREDVAIRTSVRGLRGSVARPAALELVVRFEETIMRPAILVQMPPAVAVDEALVSSMRNAGCLADVEARAGGIIRMRGTPRGRDFACIIPMPVRWQAAGEVSGFATIAYDEDDPHRMTVTEATPLSIADDRPLDVR